MGNKSLAVLTVDRFNDEGFFYKELYGRFARWQKSGRNNEVTVLPRYLMAGFQCNAIFFSSSEHRGFMPLFHVLKIHIIKMFQKAGTTPC